MKKEVLIKAKTEEVIADFLRPIIRYLTVLIFI